MMSKKNEGQIWRELKQHLMEKISFTASESNRFIEKSYEATEDQITPASTYFAFGSIVNKQLFDVFVLMDSAFDYLLELERRIEIKSAQLQKIILQLAERSNISMGTLKTELSDVKSKMENPMLIRIDKFLTEFQEAEKKRKKEMGDQYVG